MMTESERKERKRQLDHERYLRNKEQVKADSHERYARNKEKIAENHRRYYQAHKEEINLRRAKWEYDHPLKTAIFHRNYWLKHPEDKRYKGQLSYWTREMERLVAEGAKT